MRIYLVKQFTVIISNRKNCEIKKTQDFCRKIGWTTKVVQYRHKKRLWWSLHLAQVNKQFRYRLISNQDKYAQVYRLSLNTILSLMQIKILDFFLRTSVKSYGRWYLGLLNKQVMLQFLNISHLDAICNSKSNRQLAIPLEIEYYMSCDGIFLYLLLILWNLQIVLLLLSSSTLSASLS